jgi:hypothetical protein
MRTHSCLCLIGLGLVGCSAAADPSGSEPQNETAAEIRNAGNVCTPAEQADALARALTQPITPPYTYAGLDISGGAAGGGLTYEQATQVLCQGTQLGVDGNRVEVSWGPKDEIYAEYDATTHKMNLIEVSGGYEGKIAFKSRPTSVTDPTKPNPFGTHTYSVGVGSPIQRDGADWELDWKDFDKQSTELFDALMFTFAPDQPSVQDSCHSAQACMITGAAAGADRAFGARPIRTYFRVSDGAQPGASTPRALYTFLR